MASEIMENGGQRKHSDAPPSKVRPVSELSEDEQLQLALNASLNDDPIVIDEDDSAAASPKFGKSEDCIIVLARALIPSVYLNCRE